jgi:hypothetical protein
MKSPSIAQICHTPKMANKENQFRTRFKMSKLNYFTGKSMRTDKATPSNYGVLQNGTKSATF